MWYGLTRKNFISGLTVFGIIGLIAALAGVINAWIKQPATINYGTLLALFLFVPALWIALFVVLSITSLRIEGEELQWFAWRKILLKRCRVQSVRAIGPGWFSAMIIKTDVGTIRLFGLHMNDRVALSRHLLQLKPSIKSNA